MKRRAPKPSPKLQLLPKCPTGIRGLDEITGGGLPRGRPTLICGSAGCGKTLMAAEFLVRGAAVYGEPGVLMAFEETEAELEANVARMIGSVEACLDLGRLRSSTMSEYLIRSVG